jgi:alkanesulfonate monooxygenase SsuD/methylene tetrahydromethanopterin reductase-like flavin-dependent oxidoreductase (luciferase family)
MMRLGVYFDGFATTSEMCEAARAAEEAGAASLWFAQHMGYRDAFVSAAAVAGATRAAALVPTANSV